MARIYVTQFSGWWSLTPDQARKWIEDAKTGPWNLSDYGHQLGGRPGCVRVHRDRPGYYTTDGSVLFQMPCDWECADWQYARELMNEVTN